MRWRLWYFGSMHVYSWKWIDVKQVMQRNLEDLWIYELPLDEDIANSHRGLQVKFPWLTSYKAKLDSERVFSKNCLLAHIFTVCSFCQHRITHVQESMQNLYAVPNSVQILSHRSYANFGRIRIWNECNCNFCRKTCVKFIFYFFGMNSFSVHGQHCNKKISKNIKQQRNLCRTRWKFQKD